MRQRLFIVNRLDRGVSDKIFKIANGKIVEQRTFRDRPRFLTQLGVLEPSSPEYEHVFQALKEVSA